ncbi:Beta-phosphoglucomutase [hydrothermal vent metagenome]|uniref:Beta-phosphoglucomutase n=1 Tax=hydrothermal vent metagenome TaxID=652676 RepID=A0A3B0VBY7_9ZZZZ
MNKGFIFDLDGVIVDTAKYHFLAWKKIADELKFDFTLEHNERLKGVSRLRSLDILLEIGGIIKSESEQSRLASKKNNLYLELIKNLNSNDLLPGSKSFIIDAKDKAIKIALGSASKNAAYILKKLGVAHLFDARIDGTMVSKAKPDPEVFLKASNLLGLKPAQCLVFEDAQAGIDAAKNAGMKCIGIGDSNILHSADKVVGSLDQITVPEALDILKKQHTQHE